MMMLYTGKVVASGARRREIHDVLAKGAGFAAPSSSRTLILLLQRQLRSNSGRQAR